jgi:hypothetical protein
MSPIDSCGIIDDAQLATIKMLLDAGSNVNCQDLRGDTPLHQGVRYTYNQRAIRMLLDYKTDPSIRNFEGRQALDIVKSFISYCFASEERKIQARQEEMAMLSAALQSQRQNEQALACTLSMATHERLGSQSPLSLLPQQLLAEIAHKTAVAERGEIVRLPQKRPMFYKYAYKVKSSFRSPVCNAIAATGIAASGLCMLLHYYGTLPV